MRDRYMSRVSLRLLMGLQMWIYGVLPAGDLPLSGKTLVMRMDGASLWMLEITIAGMALVLPALADLLVRFVGRESNRYSPVKLALLIGRCRFAGSVLAGSIWIGFCYTTAMDGRINTVDLQALVYAMFLLWVACEDAYRSRKIAQRESLGLAAKH